MGVYLVAIRDIDLHGRGGKGAAGADAKLHGRSKRGGSGIEVEGVGVGGWRLEVGGWGWGFRFWNWSFGVEVCG